MIVPRFLSPCFAFFFITASLFAADAPSTPNPAKAPTTTAKAEVSGQKDIRSKIPARDAAAKPGMVDLTDYYNAILTETWHPGNQISLQRRNDLSGMPRGIQKFSDIEFDVRGLVQLLGRGPKSWGGVFPEHVNGIKVGKSAKTLHFLHGTGYQAKDGTTIGYYIVNYETGPERKIPIVYGMDVRDWWFWENEPEKADRSKVAWKGTNEASEKAGMSLRVYSSSWTNPQPDDVIKSIDYVSTMATPAPFLIAITLE
jgi:hypothetical protein